MVSSSILGTKLRTRFVLMPTVLTHFCSISLVSQLVPSVVKAAGGRACATRLVYLFSQLFIHRQIDNILIAVSEFQVRWPLAKVLGASETS